MCHDRRVGSHTARTTFDPQAFLDSAGVARTVATYRKAETIYSQGDVCKTVMYLQQGEVKLSVLSNMGREAVVAALGPGNFSGEGALAQALLLLARYSEPTRPQRTISKISQKTLAEIAGITRARVHFFMNTFKKRGFIENDGLTINSSLLNVVLHD